MIALLVAVGCHDKDDGAVIATANNARDDVARNSATPDRMASGRPTMVTIAGDVFLFLLLSVFIVPGAFDLLVSDREVARPPGTEAEVREWGSGSEAGRRVCDKQGIYLCHLSLLATGRRILAPLSCSDDV